MNIFCAQFILRLHKVSRLKSEQPEDWNSFTALLLNQCCFSYSQPIQQIHDNAVDNHITVMHPTSRPPRRSWDTSETLVRNTCSRSLVDLYNCLSPDSSTVISDKGCQHTLMKEGFGHPNVQWILVSVNEENILCRQVKAKKHHNVSEHTWKHTWYNCRHSLVFYTAEVLLLFDLSDPSLTRATHNAFIWEP